MIRWIFILFFLFTTSTKAQTSWIVDAAKTSERVIINAGSPYYTKVIFNPLSLGPIILTTNHRVSGYNNSLPLMKVRRATSGDEVDIYDFQHGTANYSISPNGTFSEDGIAQTHYITSWYDLTSAIGIEKVINGTFDIDSDWTKGAGWTIGGGTANANILSNGISLSQSIVGITANTFYLIDFDISNYVSGDLYVWIGGTNKQQGFTSNKHYTVVLKTINTSGVIFQTFGSFVGSIDNVSVREFQGEHVIQTTAILQPRLLWQGVTPDGIEKVLNGDMEANTSWTNRYVSGTLTQERSSEQAHTGTYSRKVVTDTNTNGFNQLLSFTAGKTYYISGWIYNASSTRAALFAYNSTDGYTYSEPVFNNPGWQYVSFTFSPAAGGNSYVGGIKYLNSGQVTTFYVDDFSVQESNTNYNFPVVFCDGLNDYLVNINNLTASWMTSAGSISAYYTPNDDNYSVVAQVNTTSGYWRFSSDLKGYLANFRNVRLIGYPTGGVMPIATSARFHIVSGLSYNAWLDGADQGNQTTDWKTPDFFRYCYEQTGAGYYRGAIRAVNILNKDISSIDIADMDTYFETNK